MELVLAIGKAGFRVSEANAHELIYGYGAGLDMTRRDLQLVARDKGRPWDTGKDIEQGSVCTEIVPMSSVVIENAAIALEVNGATKQSSDVNKLIWNIREIIADLSTYYHLQPGDLIYTGTPEGVGAVLPGDKITGRVEGVAELAFTTEAAATTFMIGQYGENGPRLGVCLLPFVPVAAAVVRSSSRRRHLCSMGSTLMWCTLVAMPSTLHPPQGSVSNTIT
jgi:hypothetical protein